MTSTLLFGSTIDPAAAKRKRGRPRTSTVAAQRQKHIACAEMHIGRGWKVQTVVNELRKGGKRASLRSVKTWIKLALSYPECAHLAVFARPRRASA